MKTDDELKKQNPELYKIAREGGTETPFSGKYVNTKEKGMYKCAICGNILFSSETKFSADGQPGLEGWPSFDQALPGSVEYVVDDGYGMHRTEVLCSKCKSHLGHLFDDHTTPTKKHFCINSVCLDLEKDENN